VLKHRGVSHSFFIVALCSALVYVLLDGVSRADVMVLPIPSNLVAPYTLAFAFGMLSHLAGDACTKGGIQPALPFHRGRFWLLPRFFRTRSDGAINGFGRLAGVLFLGLALAAYLSIE
jgi:membrane-bound metal-dependent hydrolase YbcI (DUF457 family)